MGGRTVLLGAAALAAGLALAGCGGGTSVPAEAVVRAWSDAVNTGQDERAAQLLAKGAIAIRGTSETVLRDEAQATAWNQAQRCAGLPQKVQTHADIVTVTFALRDREQGSCTARGGTATWEFEVRKGRIVFLRLLAAAPAAHLPAAAPAPATTTG